MEKSINLPTLQTTFSLPMAPHKLSAFRGAVAHSAGWEQDFFHNHDNTQVVPVEVGGSEQDTGGSEGVVTKKEQTTLKAMYHYRYPLIQYRVAGGKAVIWSIGEGTVALRKWLLTKGSSLQINHRDYPLLIEGMQENEHELRMLPHMKGYRIMNYLPLNDANYLRWRKAEDLFERMHLVETCLTGHILGFAESIGYQLPERLEVRLMNIRETRPVSVHGNKRLAFNLVYKANIDLPPALALGKAISHGFGVQMPTRRI